MYLSICLFIYMLVLSLVHRWMSILEVLIWNSLITRMKSFNAMPTGTIIRTTTTTIRIIRITITITNHPLIIHMIWSGCAISSILVDTILFHRISSHLNIHRYPFDYRLPLPHSHPHHLHVSIYVVVVVSDISLPRSFAYCRTEDVQIVEEFYYNQGNL